MPTNISLLNALDGIGETILVADTSYNILWMNTEACRLLAQVAPLFGIEDCESLIGLNMDQFHGRPEHQRIRMIGLKGAHRARINIQNDFVTDIVITPIKGEKKQSKVKSSS